MSQPRRASPRQTLLLLALTPLIALAAAGGLATHELAAIDAMQRPGGQSSTLALATAERSQEARLRIGALLGLGLLLALPLLGLARREPREAPDDIATLSAVSRVLVRDSDVETLTAEALETILAVLGLSRGMLLLHDEPENELVRMHYRGGPTPIFEHLERVPIGPDSPWLAGHAAHQRRVVGLREIASAPSLAPLRDQLEALEIRGLVAVPVIGGDRLIGVLVLARSDRDFHAREIETSQLLGQHMGFAIESARACRALRAADQLKSDFVANVTHELRTPLTAIKGATTILRARAELPPEMSRFVDMIQAHSQRLGGLVQDLLDLSAVESGRLACVLTPVSLAALLDEACGTRRAEADRKGIRLVLEPLPALPPVLGDRERLRQVLIHLIDNGLKFTPAGGEVRLAAALAEPFVRVEIKDNGLGIPAEDQARLFESFQQGGPSLTGKPAGAGLGLALSRRLVEAHGGAIDLESAPGRGSTFRFTVRLAER